MNASTILGVVAGLLRIVSGLWGSGDSGGETVTAITNALGSASLILTDLASSSPTLSLHQFETECRGVIAIRLAPYIDHADVPPAWVIAARESVVYEALALFVKLHPSSTSVG